ncbi:hypothetical protein AV530_010927 [Patagioenas fasciata monilis]|uniref:Uncharacterized protein n=1 Tax=Patagioenas fasciata monilis TaxID=372326 RepID=A0A1V4K8G0_PATFA|nr:hypothetical protein AV530_010927 [Patagioenas fasciata monilis]
MTIGDLFLIGLDCVEKVYPDEFLCLYYMVQGVGFDSLSSRKVGPLLLKFVDLPFLYADQRIQMDDEPALRQAESSCGHKADDEGCTQVVPKYKELGIYSCGRHFHLQVKLEVEDTEHLSGFEQDFGV